MSAFKYAGTVSEGTLLPEDLIPKFLTVLSELNEDWYNSADPDTKRAGEKVAEEIESMELDMQEDDFFDDDEAVQEDLDWLIETLNELAPKGYYFGAHPGDGADFGFWEVEGENEDDED